MNMKDEKMISDEQINALIDNQLSADECAQLLNMAATNKGLAGRIETRRRLKDMITQAYAPRAPRHDVEAPVSAITQWRSLAATVTLVVIGALAGVGGHIGYLAMQDKTQLEDIAMVKAAPDKVILQIASDDPQRMQQTLKVAEELLHASKAKSANIQLEVIANNIGLKMLDVNSPHREKIARLSHENSNVKFLACGLGMKRLKSRGEQVTLLSDAIIVSSVAEQVARRLNEGWSYMRE